MQLTFNNLINKIKKTTNDKHLIRTFSNCFFDTWKNCIKYVDDEVFLITGDIPAMWLRDSSAQVLHYLPFAKERKIASLIKGLLKRQFKMILIDQYANAFKENENDVGEWDKTMITNPHSKIVWERKFELDSLCYPLFLICKYYEYTNDISVFTDLFYEAFAKVIKTIKIELNHDKLSNYYFDYTFSNKQKITRSNHNKNSNYGLVWTGFRPSDDICKYHYHIPDNMFLVSILYKLEIIFKEKLYDTKNATVCHKLLTTIKHGIEKYGIKEINSIGKVYISETNCKNHYTTDDDANIPSLLSIPYLEYPFLNKDIYHNTRKLILSNKNSFYYEGKVLKGIGSPHVKKNFVWPLSIIMQGLTSDNEQEIKKCLAMLLKSDNNKELMHESVDANNPQIYTREWFGWANSLFAEFCLRKIFKIVK